MSLENLHRLIGSTVILKMVGSAGRAKGARYAKEAGPDWQQAIQQYLRAILHEEGALSWLEGLKRASQTSKEPSSLEADL